MSTPPRSNPPTAPRPAPPLFSPEPTARRRDLTGLWLLALIASCALALALQIWHFWPFLSEGAYASLHYSEALLKGRGLAGVEGYVNLLWVLLVAALGAVGLPLVTAAHLLGIAGTVIGITAVGCQVYRDYPAKVKFISALVGCLALCLSAPIGAWSLGGLEQPLLGALLAWAAFFCIRWVSTSRGSTRDANLTGLLLALAVLTRNDAFLFAFLFYLGALLTDGFRIPAMLARARILALPILGFAGQLLFRHVYYHAWFPAPQAFAFHGFAAGLRYNLTTVGSDAAFMLLAIIGALALWIAQKQREVVLLATICIGWLLYILAIGGDSLPAGRQFVPVMMLMGFLAAGCGLLTLAAPFRFSGARLAIFLGLTALVLTSDLFAHPELESVAIVPAYLADEASPAALQRAQGDVQLLIAPGGSVHFSALPLPSGAWQVSLAGVGTVQLTLMPASSACPLCISAVPGHKSTITVTNTGSQPVLLHALTLTRRQSSAPSR